MLRLHRHFRSSPGAGGGTFLPPAHGGVTLLEEIRLSGNDPTGRLGGQRACRLPPSLGRATPEELGWSGSAARGARAGPGRRPAAGTGTGSGEEAPGWGGREVGWRGRGARVRILLRVPRGPRLGPRQGVAGPGARPAVPSAPGAGSQAAALGRTAQRPGALARRSRYSRSAGWGRSASRSPGGRCGG